MSKAGSSLRRAKLAIQTVFDGVFDQYGNVVPHPASIQGTVLLLDDVLNMFPWHGRILFGEPVHNMAKRTQFFINSHRPMVGIG